LLNAEEVYAFAQHLNIFQKTTSFKDLERANGFVSPI